MRIAVESPANGLVVVTTPNGILRVPVENGVAEIADPDQAAAFLRCLPGASVLDEDPSDDDTETESGGAPAPAVDDPAAKPAAGTEENSDS